jgi:predicted HTH transcriptional regulator
VRLFPFGLKSNILLGLIFIQNFNMDIHKIEQILSGGEHERVAFHAANNEVELGDVVVSVAAMANGTGGTIFLGVDKDGTNI